MENKVREIREPLIMKDLEKQRDRRVKDTGSKMLTNFLPACITEYIQYSSFLKYLLVHTAKAPLRTTLDSGNYHGNNIIKQLHWWML